MFLTTLGKQLIKHFEGLRLETYKCSAGYPTIGWGHRQSSPNKIKITKERAEELFTKDILKFEEGVHKLLKKDVVTNPSQFSALVSFAFNVGLSNLEKSTLLKMHNSENADVDQQFLRWNKITIDGQKVPEKGLTRRRTWEAMLYRGEREELERLLNQ